MKKRMTNQKYNEYVENITPKHNLPISCLKAFIVGGAICTLGEFIITMLNEKLNLPYEIATNYSTVILVLISIILTGLNLYKPIVNWGGAGGLVPVTGFANSVASPTIEYQTEGEIFGKGVKIFTIAGPVILFGIFTSFILGIIYYIVKLI